MNRRSRRGNKAQDGLRRGLGSRIWDLDRERSGVFWSADTPHSSLITNHWSLLTSLPSVEIRAIRASSFSQVQDPGTPPQAFVPPSGGPYAPTDGSRDCLRQPENCGRR